MPSPSSSGGGLLTLFHCSSMGSLPWETVLHRLLQCELFLEVAAFPFSFSVGLFHGILSRNRLHLEVTIPANKPAPTWCFLSLGSQDPPVEAFQWLLQALGSDESILESAGTGCTRCGESSGSFFRSHLCSPLPCKHSTPVNLQRKCIYLSSWSLNMILILSPEYVF